MELFRYSILFKDLVALKGDSLHRREGALIRLTSQDGSEGWGEASPLPGFSPETLEDAIDQLKSMAPTVIGQEIDPHRLVTDDAPISNQDRLEPSACFGLETALLNLAANSREKSLPELLTDHPRGSVAVSGLISGSIEEALAEARYMKEAGYRAVKLKVGRRSVAEDVEAVGAVTGVLGGGVSLRLDANRAWGFDEARAFARGASGVPIEYVEEPLYEAGRLPELERGWGLPVALDESLVGMSAEALKEYSFARAVVLKPTLLGGVSRVLRFVEVAKGLGVAPVVSSSYESGVGTGALVALAAVAGGPAGLDTYRVLAEDVIRQPLSLRAPEIDVMETMRAAGMVDVGLLEPISLP